MPYTDVSAAAVALANPATSPAELAEIAGHFPSLWAGIAAHANVYDGLLNWLDHAGDDQVRAAVAIRRQGPPPTLVTPEMTAPLVAKEPTPSDVCGDPAITISTTNNDYISATTTPDGGDETVASELETPPASGGAAEPTMPVTNNDTKLSPDASLATVASDPVTEFPAGAVHDATGVATQEYPSSAWASTPGQHSGSGLGVGLTSATTPKMPKTPKKPRVPKGAKSPQPSSAIVQPAPYEPMPQPGQTPPPAEPKKSSAGKVALIVGLVVVLLLGVVAAGYFLWFKPKQDAEESLVTAQANFAQAVESYNVAQDKLRVTIQGANHLLDTLQVEDIANPTLLTDLDDKAEEVGALLIAAPEMAADVEAIEAQVNDLTKAELETVTATQDLNDAANDVIRSLVEKSSEALTAGIEKAQEALTEAQSLAGVDKEKEALKEVIDEAQNALDSLAATQPEEVISTVEKHVAALDEATNALKEAIGTSCGGVELPDGVTTLVCGGMPSGATSPEVRTAFEDILIFSHPSGTIGCTKTGYNWYQVMCEVSGRSWTIPTQLLPGCLSPNPGTQCSASVALPVIEAGKVGAAQTSGVPPWAANKSDNQVTIPTLAYGSSADMAESAACYSESDGITCWDVVTHHGFKVSQDNFLHW